MAWVKPGAGSPPLFRLPPPTSPESLQRFIGLGWASLAAGGGGLNSIAFYRRHSLWFFIRYKRELRPSCTPMPPIKDPRHPPAVRQYARPRLPPPPPPLQSRAHSGIATAPGREPLFAFVTGAFERCTTVGGFSLHVCTDVSGRASETIGSVNTKDKDKGRGETRRFVTSEKTSRRS